MTTIASHLTAAELEARYETAADPVAKSHFHAIWLLSLNYGIEEVAELLSFSIRWVRLLVKRYNEQGPEGLGDRRLSNGAAPAILTRHRIGLKPIVRRICCSALLLFFPVTAWAASWAPRVTRPAIPAVLRRQNSAARVQSRCTK